MTRGCPTRWRPRCHASRCPRTSRSSWGPGTCRAAGCSTSSRPWTGCARPAAVRGTPSRPTRAWRRTWSRRPTRCCTPSRAATAGTSPRSSATCCSRSSSTPGSPRRRGPTRSTSTPSRGCSSRSWSGATPTSSPTATPRRPPRSSRPGSGSRPRRRPPRGPGGATRPTCCTASRRCPVTSPPRRCSPGCAAGPRPDAGCRRSRRAGRSPARPTRGLTPERRMPRARVERARADLAAAERGPGRAAPDAPRRPVERLRHAAGAAGRSPGTTEVSRRMTGSTLRGLERVVRRAGACFVGARRLTSAT